MVKGKYNELEPVCWREVLRCLEWALSVRRLEADLHIDRVIADIDHAYPERYPEDLQRTLRACEYVFQQYELLCSVRRFLRYKPKTPERLELLRCMRFWAKESPGGGSLAAHTLEGQNQD